jgi:protein-S-isoprenylcysteine O-methyltransferase Ste14
LRLKKKLQTKENKKFLSGGSKGLPASFFLIYIALEYEKAFNVQRYEIGETWFFVLFFLIFLEATLIFFWSLLGFITKGRARGFNTKGIYAFVRHPICTLVVFHINILASLWFGSHLLLFLIPLQYLLWLKIIVREEEYLVGIFGQEYIDYMSNVSRFIPWK